MHYIGNVEDLKYGSAGSNPALSAETLVDFLELATRKAASFKEDASSPPILKSDEELSI
ncbi:MAG: hypothetical protein QXN55_00775 [Candidatus Nitrosotenuis sp.]